MINIIITGFMGCGKTTLGRMIAERLKMNFFDTDELIERREGLSVSEIFEKFGEDHFRKIEMEIVKILGKERKSVISTGGKTLLFDKNLKVFSEKGVIITLTSEPEILWERIKKEGNRPLIKNGDKEIFMKLHDERKSLYEKLPNRIDISALSEVKAVEKLLEFLTKESKRIVIKIGDKESLIIFKRFILNDIENAFLPLGAGRLFLICDSRLFEIYSSEIKGFFQNFFLLPGKDKSKNFRNVKKIWRWLLNRGVKRDSVIVSIGGGVIGDICGFVSSTILRGIEHHHIPTTLLSMLDSSIGGKNGINFDSIKNAIGTISPPQKVYVDPIFLSSIPEKELAFGLVEGIKAGFIGDFEIIELIEKKLNLIKRRDIEILEEIISRAINVKKSIVEKDPYERELRKILNLGHTLAHALESYHKYKIPHGEAVGIGLIYSLKISEILGFSAPEHMERIKFLFERLGLRKKVNGSKRDLIELMKKDKKTTERGLDFILINNSGEPFIMRGIPEEILLEALEEVIDENSHN